MTQVMRNLLPTEKHDVTFTIDEDKVIYKSSCLNEIFKSKKLSKDRLRRVQSLSGFPGIDVSGNDSDAFSQWEIQWCMPLMRGLS